MAVSLIGVAALPALIGTATDRPAQEPQPKKASLTIQLSPEEVAGDSAQVSIRAKGDAPTTPTILARDDGLESAVARAVDADWCDGFPVHQTAGTAANTPWCVAITNLMSRNVSLSGSLSGTETELALTVNRRLPFFWIPFLFILAGLLLGGLAIAVPRLLRGSVRTVLLDRLIQRNDNAPKGSRVDDLRDWVNDQREAGKSDDELLPVAYDLVRRGPDAARRARVTLAAADGASSLPGDHPARKVAASERDSHRNECKDFLAEDWSPVIHPAILLADVLNELERHGRRLRELAEEPVASEPQPAKSLDAAWSRFDSVESTTQMPALKEAVDDVARSIALARRKDPTRGHLEMMTTGFANTEFSIAVGNVVVVDTMSRLATTLRAIRPLSRPVTLSALVVLAVAAWAVLTISLTVYEPKPAFGETKDLLALLVAAVGSGAAGTIAGIVAIWDPEAPAQKID